MKNWVQITIEAGIPEDKQDLGHEGVVASKAGAEAVVAALVALGLVEVTQTRRILKRKGPRTSDQRIRDPRQIEIDTATATATFESGMAMADAM
ncbi:MAG TPA: hypothetical protein VHU42_18440 [Rhodopila sp.]|nr:hypothetical protein [Rhodopila sp.]